MLKFALIMKFSIVIATYNRADELVKTLESLRTLKVYGPWEVIIVDNNSRDNTREVVLEAAPQNRRKPLYIGGGIAACLVLGLSLFLVLLRFDSERITRSDYLPGCASG